MSAHPEVKGVQWLYHGWCPGDPEAPLTERIISNGTSQFVYQCRRCGGALSNPIKRLRAYVLARSTELPRFIS